jgi:hypothetical protein
MGAQRWHRAPWGMGPGAWRPSKSECLQGAWWNVSGAFGSMRVASAQEQPPLGRRPPRLGLEPPGAPVRVFEALVVRLGPGIRERARRARAGGPPRCGRTHPRRQPAGPVRARGPSTPRRRYRLGLCATSGQRHPPQERPPVAPRSPELEPPGAPGATRTVTVLQAAAADVPPPPPPRPARRTAKDDAVRAHSAQPPHPPSRARGPPPGRRRRPVAVHSVRGFAHPSLPGPTRMDDSDR